MLVDMEIALQLADGRGEAAINDARNVELNGRICETQATNTEDVLSSIVILPANAFGLGDDLWDDVLPNLEEAARQHPLCRTRSVEIALLRRANDSSPVSFHACCGKIERAVHGARVSRRLGAVVTDEVVRDERSKRRQRRRLARFLAVEDNLIETFEVRLDFVKVRVF